MLPSELIKFVDARMYKDLLDWRDLCFSWLLLSTKIVVIGLVLEGPELVKEIISIVRHWRFVHMFHFSLPEDHIPEW